MREKKPMLSFPSTTTVNNWYNDKGVFLMIVICYKYFIKRQSTEVINGS